MTLQETLDWCKGEHAPSEWCKLMPVSEAVLEVRDEVAAKQFPYNDDIERAFKGKYGLTLPDLEAHNLGTLVYCAQKHADKRDEEAEDKAGNWVATTLDWLKENTGKKIEVKGGDSIFGRGRERIAKVKEIGGNLYLMEPRAKRRYFSLGTKARVMVSQ